MSLLAALSASLTGLDAARRNVQLTAHNAANVHTDGYSRKTIEQMPIVLNGEGMGVNAAAVRRLADDYLSRELRAQKSALASDQVLASFHDRLQAVLFGPPGETSHGVAQKVAVLASALEVYANQPEKVATRAAAYAALADFAATIATAGNTIQKLRGEAEARINEVVAAVNRDLAALDELNRQVAIRGLSPELLDQRDRLLESLAEKIEISVADLDRGMIAVYARGGVPLLEYGAKRLIYTPATGVSAHTVFGPIVAYDSQDIDPVSGQPKPGAKGLVLVEGGRVATTSLRTGQLAGLLQVRDHMLPALAGQYDELAELARFALNAAHNEAWPSPPPAGLTGSRTGAPADYNAATRSGTAYAAVIDRATGDTLATITLDLSLDAHSLVAAFHAGLAGYGSAAFTGDGALSVSLAPGYGIALAAGDGVIRETDSEGRDRQYSLAHFFGLNDLLVRSGPQPTDLAIAPAIAADRSRLGHARLDVDAGGPTVVLGGPGDNRGAIGLATALLTRHQTLARGEIPARAVDLRTYVGDLTAAAARATADAERTVQSRRILVDDLSARRAAISGVSLDDELARLTLYQQAYAASARILSTVDAMLEELMRVIR